jgi:hypothetical protein
MRDTIDMARETGVAVWNRDLKKWQVDQNLKDFEALVRADERNRTWTQEHWTEYERSIAAAEREACAKVCSEWSDYTKGIAPTLAERIRARGNT